MPKLQRLQRIFTWLVAALIIYAVPSILSFIFETEISIISACMDRNVALQSTISSWLDALDTSGRRGNVILVDWSSQIPLEETLKNLELDQDSRIEIIRVENETMWIRTIAYNLAASASKSRYIFKVDCDTYLSKQFFQRISLGSNNYFTANLINAQSENDLYLHGISAIPRIQFENVHGLDERIQTYGYEDDDFYQRLDDYGLSRNMLDYSRMRHLSHTMDASKIFNTTKYGLEVEWRLNQRLAKELAPWSKAHEKSTFIMETLSKGRTSARLVARSQKNSEFFTDKQLNQLIENVLRERLIELGVSQAQLQKYSSLDQLDQLWITYKDGPMMTIHVTKSLGCRIQSLISGMVIARRTGRHLRVIWPTDRSFGASFEDLFDMPEIDVWTTLDPSELKSQTVNVYDYTQHKNTIDHVTLKHIYAKSESFLKSPLINAEELGYSLGGLALNAHLQSRIEAGPDLSHCFGVHLDSNERNLGLDEFIRKMQSILDETSYACFYVSSENPKYKKLLSKKFGSKAIIHHKSCSDPTKECLEESLIDLVSLLSTLQFLGSPSSVYSQIAALVMENIWLVGQDKV